MATTFGDLLPLAAVAGIAFFLANSESKDGKPRTNHTENKSYAEELNEQHMADMRAYGASASFWGAEHNKLMLNHADRGKELSLMTPDSARNVESIFQQHADIAHYDSAETMLAVQTNQGEIRMRRRNPIVSTLSHSVENCANPAMQATFDYYYENINYANPAQVRQTQAIVKADENANPDNAARRYYGVELFNRAYGQSFRYSEG
jgi:hypothetical protein